MSTLSVDTIQGKTTSTKVDMPSGTMVQMTKVRDFQDSNLVASRLQSASTSYVASALEARITPKYADSIINVRFASSISTNQDSAHLVAYTIYRSINGGSYSALTNSGDYGIGSVFGTDRTQAPLIAECVDQTHNTTNQIIYKVYARSNQGNVGNFELPNTDVEHYEAICIEVRA
tara:strand:+ start:461 stop:985 length:525 start_codon:yes stop_codon:yes gene_type:complete